LPAALDHSSEEDVRLRVLPLAVGAILFATAMPDELRAPVAWNANFDVRDFVVNVLLYLPLGLAGWRWPLAAAAVLGGTMSGAIEFLQLWYFGRQGGVFDVVANALGVAVGVGAGRWWVHRGHDDPASVAIGRGAAAAASLGALLLVLAWSWPARPSSLANWDRSFRMLLGNETTLDRPWRGTVVALALLPERIDAHRARQLSTLADGDFSKGALGPAAHVLPASVVLGDVPAIALPVEVAQRFFDLAVVNDAFAVVARFIPEDDRQAGPARVITFSGGPFQRNFDLGQAGPRLVFRVRTPTTGLNGMAPHTETPAVLASGRPVTVVASFDGAVARLHVDGEPQGRRNLAAAGCVLEIVCDTDLRFSAALFGALVAVVVLALCRPRSAGPRTVVVVATALAAAALVDLLTADHGGFLKGWGAPLLTCAAAISVGGAARAPGRVRQRRDAAP
jgi:VanZ like family